MLEIAINSREKAVRLALTSPGADVGHVGESWLLFCDRSSLFGYQTDPARAAKARASV